MLKPFITPFWNIVRVENSLWNRKLKATGFGSSVSSTLFLKFQIALRLKRLIQKDPTFFTALVLSLKVLVELVTPNSV